MIGDAKLIQRLFLPVLTGEEKDLTVIIRMQPVQTGFQTFAVIHGEAVIKEQRHVFLWPEKPHHGEPEGKIELLHSARGQRAGRYFSACGKGKQLQIIAHFKK